MKKNATCNELINIRFEDDCDTVKYVFEREKIDRKPKLEIK